MYRVIVQQDHQGYIELPSLTQAVILAGDSLTAVEAAVRRTFRRVRRADLATINFGPEHVGRYRASDALGRYSVVVRTI